jgi:hypothetical protein
MILSGRTIVWDLLGWFPPQVVPVLFPSNKSTDFTRVCKAVLAYTRSYVATTLDRRLTSLQGGAGNGFDWRLCRCGRPRSTSC